MIETGEEGAGAEEDDEEEDEGDEGDGGVTRCVCGEDSESPLVVSPLPLRTRELTRLVCTHAQTRRWPRAS